MKASFPWFGGKSQIAPMVWERFGRLTNYVEPFAGSMAMLLDNPHPATTETVNDADCWLSNFWRAVKLSPNDVAKFADYPVSELDLHARGDWLFYGNHVDEFRENMRSNHEFYDAKMAGFWLWGICSWIGDGWGRQENNNNKLSVCRTLPRIGDSGVGINRQIHHLFRGKEINSKIQNCSYTREDYLHDMMQTLAERLRDVRICCGDWKRVVGPSPTVHIGLTGVFLDPPYSDDEYAIKYNGGGNVWHDVCRWAEENSNNPLLRIALCGYDGTWTPPDGWIAIKWKTRGGYANQGNKRWIINKGREVVWFSPNCLNVGLFENPTI